MNANAKTYIALHLFLMIYTVSGIVSKLAAGKEFMSLSFILLYALEILILSFYAIGWQQFIKRMPLSVAYANKAVTVVWGCVWSVLFFHEHLTAGKVIGALFVLSGVALYGYADGKIDVSAADAPKLPDTDHTGDSPATGKAANE